MPTSSLSDPLLTDGAEPAVQLWLELTRRACTDEERDSGALPGWAATLRALLLALDAPQRPIETFRMAELASAEALLSIDSDPDGPWPLHGIFERWLGYAAAELDRAAGGLGADRPAARSMLAHLARRWMAVASQLLPHRITVADLLAGCSGEPDQPVVSAFFREAGDAGWPALFRHFPVLARLYAVAYRHWLDSTVEFIERLRSDRDLLEAVFGEGRSLGPLISYAPDAGDVHGGGRSVSLLRFASGVRLAYKPKELRMAAAYQRLIREVNDAGLQPPLHIRKVQCGDGYAWEEFAESAPCPDEEAVARYYRRIGAHARLLQMLDATDFVGENILAAGEHPVLIDLETLFSPRMPFPVAATALQREAARISWDAPFRSGIITAPIAGRAGRRPADLGALASTTDGASPFRRVVHRNRGVAGVRVGHDFVALAASAGKPTLRGEMVSPAAWLPEVVRGYTDAGELLRAMAPRLRGPESALSELAAAPTRLLLRDTHIYSRLLEESLQPAALRDMATRERLLTRLWAAVTSGKADAILVRQEIDSLRDLDIPLFVVSDGRVMDAADRARSLPATFEGSGLERAHERLDALQSRTAHDEADLIQAALFTLPGYDRPDAVGPARRRNGRGRHPEPDWLEEAVRIGDRLCGWAIERGDDAAWIGLSYHPSRDQWRFGPLPSDLLTGTAGLALVLAELHAATRQRRFAAAARAAIAPLLDRLDGLASGAGGGAARLRECGAFHGWAGWYYSALRTGFALEDPGLVDRATSSLRALPIDAILDGAATCAISGSAGLVLVLAAAARRGVELPGEVAARARASLADALQRGTLLAAPTPPSSRIPARLPGPRAAALLALTRSKVECLPFLDEAPGAKPDDPLGDRLAWLALGSKYQPDQADEARPLPAITAELLDAAELALGCFAASGDERQLLRARACGSNIVETVRITGRWFDGLLAPDRFLLSGVIGLPALAHLFLRLHAGTGDSIRTVD